MLFFISCVNFLNSLKFYRSSSTFSLKISFLPFRFIDVDVAVLVQNQTLLSIVPFLEIDKLSFVTTQKTSLPLNFLYTFQSEEAFQNRYRMFGKDTNEQFHRRKKANFGNLK